MGMLADDVADYLSTQGLGTVATRIFAGTMPDNVGVSTSTGGPSGALSVKETGGIFSEHTFGASPSGIGGPVARVERPRFQVLSRATTYAQARAQIQDAFNLLDGLQAKTINGTLYQWISAVQSPFDMGLNQNLKQEFACNFDVVKAVSTSSST